MYQSEKIKEQLLNIATKYEGLTSVIEEIKSIEEEPIDINVAFLGEFSAGKSSLINSLLKKPILPAFEKPTNAVIVEIKKGEEDKITKSYQDVNENIVTEEIQFYQFAEEVMNYDDNKKIMLELKDIDFIDEHTVLIDTPGVTSINEMHTDVTFGYLPFVDVAFVLLNLNIGAPSKSFIDFLKKFPKEFLNKIYFVMTFKDTKTDAEVNKIKEYFIEALSPLFENLNILVVSSKKAMENIDNPIEYEKSGVLEIQNIITNDIPKFKKEIEERRIHEAFILKTKETLELLKYKLETINYSDDSFDNEINEHKKSITLFEDDIHNLKNKFNDIKEESIFKIQNIIKDTSDIISQFAAQNKDTTSIIDNLISEIKHVLENNLRKIKGLELKGISNNIESILSANVEKVTNQIIGVASMITDFVTIAVTSILLTPASAVGAGGIAGTVGATSTKNIAKNITKQALIDLGKKAVTQLSTKQKIIGAIGGFIKDINPLEKVKDFALPFFLKDKIKNKIQGNVKPIIEDIFDILELDLETIINNEYLIPLNNKQNILKETQKKKNDSYFEKEKLEEQIKSDIEKLSVLLKRG